MKYLERNVLFRIYATRSDAEQVLILCNLFSMALMGFRIIYTGSLLFSFLVWNLFLAFIPFALSRWISAHGQNKSKAIFLLSVFGWVVFVPNAFYIITDLFHLSMNQAVPQWYDLALLLSFAWNGLLFGILSVRHMEKIFERMTSRRPGLLFILPVMALNALGVYVGRYLRFNSWDIISDPFQLAGDILYLFIHPIRSRFDWSMIICYTVFMVLLYVTIKKLGKLL